MRNTLTSDLYKRIRDITLRRNITILTAKQIRSNNPTPLPRPLGEMSIIIIDYSSVLSK